MVDKLVTARRATNLPWIDDGRYYELTSGRRGTDSKISKSPTAFACMHIRGQELANLPWHIYRGDKILESHPLIDMLKDFGPESNYQKGILDTEIDKLTWGAGLWLRDVDTLKRLNPATIEVLKSNRGISGFKQTLSDREGKTIEIIFKREEVIYFRDYHPSDDLDFGIPVMKVCEKSVNAEIEALLMIEAHMKNDAVPGFLLTSDQDISEKEANRVLAWWNKRFRGGRNKGKVGIAGKGLKPTQVGSNMKDAGVVEILDYVVKDICKPFRVDPMLLAGMKDATYVNLSETRKFLIEDVIIPLSTEYQNVINQDLCNVVDPSVEFRFAPEELKILQEDATVKWTRLQGAITAGVISLEYAREEMGWPETAKPTEQEVAAKKEKDAEDKWERKALKALVRGDSPNVDFETDNISVDRQYLLHGRLSNAKTEDAVRACFD